MAEDGKVPELKNFVGGEYVATEEGKFLPVLAPATGEVIAQVPLSSAADVDAAVASAAAAAPAWAALTLKKRASYMFRFRELCLEAMSELEEIVMLEHGKNRVEARGSIAKGLETVEWACGLPALAAGHIEEVSRGVTCHDRREPVGVVASIVPFNFPIMVPMWTMPIALMMGNTVILKPSEKVPMTMARVMAIFKAAGFPPGVVNLVHGQVEAVNALIENDSVNAVTFVGSTRVADIVHKKTSALGKRVLALGGAKNHLIALPDCNVEMCSHDIVRSFAGCTGQRCMAASVLVIVGGVEGLLDAIVAKAAALERGQEAGQVGPVIDEASRDRIIRYIDEAEAGGARILVDGRSWADSAGSWVGPTVILHTNKDDPALHDEIFGPVLSVLQVDTREEALAIENSNPYGNAACIYTSSGGQAEWFSGRLNAGMIGVNIGVPVPREPFSFGGAYASKFGTYDITADGAMEFFSRRRKVTVKWNPPSGKDAASWMS